MSTIIYNLKTHEFFADRLVSNESGGLSYHAAKVSAHPTGLRHDGEIVVIGLVGRGSPEIVAAAMEGMFTDSSFPLPFEAGGIVTLSNGEDVWSLQSDGDRGNYRAWLEPVDRGGIGDWLAVGSGREAAYGAIAAMGDNVDGRKVIEIVSQIDHWTGGGVDSWTVDGLTAGMAPTRG